MISLTSELTDTKGRHARGWLFFDAQCRFCVRFARRSAPILTRRGIALAPLQDPRVGALLGMKRDELMRELRLMMGNGEQFGGAEVIVALSREIWWAKPVAWIANIPGAMRLLRSAYEWAAARRGCTGQECLATQR